MTPRTSLECADRGILNDRHTSHGARRLSVIIPALNEEENIGHTLSSIYKGSASEVIVVDGGSTDHTRKIAREHGATVVTSSPGRGSQLIMGVSIATGDTLLFLHADTTLPPFFDEHIFCILDKPHVLAGAFRLSIDASGRPFRLIEKMVNFRSRVRQMPYGDQAMFLRADVYRKTGGFPDVADMEDYALIRRLRSMGRVEIAPAFVVTSPRRWLEQGVWRRTLHNQFRIAAYWLSRSPGRISRDRGETMRWRPESRT